MNDACRTVHKAVLSGECFIPASNISFHIIAIRMVSKVASDATEAIRHDLFSKIMYLSNARTDSLTKPSLISRMTSDTYHVHQKPGSVQRLGVRAHHIAGRVIATASDAYIV